ncbi:hypothetical protein BDV33DRAFT_211127 [Aspergillus novoparasiticus]|uniref:Cupredoxin n=1 Tax=Aspergillus novoparasiticus TaxID=986946 RepID=A0A5N6E5I9_9EURO|nr:hypothetical protein BDV33DRAFT_211127 [Aspergillus novoparasiticus]
MEAVSLKNWGTPSFPATQLCSGSNSFSLQITRSSLLPTATTWYNQPTPASSTKAMQSPIASVSLHTSSRIPVSIPATTNCSHISGPASSSSDAKATWTVNVTPDKTTGFDPHVMNASVGDTILFSSAHGPFFLYNTTLDEPCKGETDLGNGASTNISYLVNSTDPMWFLGCQQDNEYFCFPQSHFALNPGDYRAEYLDIVHTQFMYISVTSTRQQRPTTTITTVVTLHPT